MAVYRYGKKTSDINVQPDFNVKDTKSDAFIKNRPDSTLSISLNGVEQSKHYNPNTGSQTIDIDLTDVLANQDSILQETIENLTVDSVGSNGGYIKTIKEDNGKITATRQAFDTTISKDSTNNNSPTSKAVYTAIQSLGNVFHVRDSVATFGDLPTTGNTAGDVRNVLDTDDNYVWTGTAWDPLGGSSIINTLNYTGAESAGTATQFITQVTQSKGKVSATKSSLPVSSTSVAGIVKLNNTLTSTSTTEALSAAQGKVLKDLADSKQASGSYKTTQTAVSSPTASGNTTSFIDTISQDTNGKITATKKTVPAASTTADGLMSSTDKTKLNGIESGAQVNTVTGVKGNSETNYRTGNINITKSNIGLGNVDNTADKDKNVLSATKLSNTAAIGSTTQPVYFSKDGVPVATSYSLSKSVPSDAKFTDTVYTHPSTDGNKHVPANGTANSGKFLKASATAGTYTWSELENIETLTKTSTVSPVRDTRYYIGTASLTTTINKPSRVGLMITVIANVATTIKYPNNSGTVQTQSLGAGTVQVLYSAGNGYISGFYGALWNI